MYVNQLNSACVPHISVSVTTSMNRRTVTALGSPLSLVLANVFMEDFEMTALTTADF